MQTPDLIRRHPIVSYFFLAFLISWAGSIAFIGPRFIQGGAFQPTDLVYALFLMLLGPGLSGLLLTWIVDGSAGLRSLSRRMCTWKVGCRWYAAAILIFPVLLLTILYTLSWTRSPEFMPSFVGLGIVYGLLAGFIEEIGWTGYAYPKMRLIYSALTAGLIIGVLHCLWHFVADYLGSSQALGIFWLPHFILMWGIAMAAMRLIIVWIYENTQSLLLAQLTHASSTGFLIALSPSPITPASETFWYGIYAIALWLIVAVIIIKNKELYLGAARISS